MSDSVGIARGATEDGQMNAIGLVVAAGSALLLLPVLPFLALVYAVSRLAGGEESGSGSGAGSGSGSPSASDSSSDPA
jgi:hypothetical protein